MGRHEERELLEKLFRSERFEFGVIHGRRRVGKTTLFRKSVIGKGSLFLLAQRANAKTNLDLFSKRYGDSIGVKGIAYDSFYHLFEAYSKRRT